MFSVFDESGIFIAVCRHRFVLLACDMVKSGELYILVLSSAHYSKLILSAKYPLALMNQLLPTFGANGGCAYNIGCAFAKTLANSSVGPLAKKPQSSHDGWCLSWPRS
jgi:hypothetical protein